MITQENLNSFRNLKTSKNAFVEIIEVAPYILKLTPKSQQAPGPSMGFLALVHGNEEIGLPILGDLANAIITGSVILKNEVYLGLGNIDAALASRRFVEEDLNRCFGKENADSIEANRARIIEKAMLNHCEFLIDIHQTVFNSENPFFIFQYSSPSCLENISKWNPITDWNSGIPVILQEDQIGADTGLSTDEYLRSKNKFGTALELGKLGGADHFNLGLKICLNALERSAGSAQNTELNILRLKGNYKALDAEAKLDIGWANLKPFSKGQRLGTDSRGEIYGPCDGYMLFPRYRKVSEGEDLFFFCIHHKSTDEFYLSSKKSSIARPVSALL